ncbi:MAG: hypothetical protein M3R15_29555 [Acidobacteriota bacterium]|nr:hypothetical protein [Acidobacteriota bacterium]
MPTAAPTSCCIALCESATVGAGAGAGSVYAQGSDDLELMSGTEVTLTASAPR